MYRLKMEAKNVRVCSAVFTATWGSLLAGWSLTDMAVGLTGAVRSQFVIIEETSNGVSRVRLYVIHYGSS
jgi:hypothetical protein